LFQLFLCIKNGVDEYPHSTNHPAPPLNCSISIVPKVYEYGYPIRVVYNQSDGVYGYLNLPYNSGYGCNWSPVAFLKDQVSQCPYRLDPDSCSKNGVLDYQMFLIPLPKGIEVGNIPKVLSLADANQIAPLEVTYFAAQEPNSYVSRQDPSKYGLK
jgi:hypothetical protein